MRDAVLDTTVVAFANRQLAARKPGNKFDRRLRLLERAVAGKLRIRHNSKLRREYAEHVRERRNDVIEVFFALLDSPRAVAVAKSALSRQQYQRSQQARWPSHDQHLLAAAIGGWKPSIYVTERQLADCAGKIRSIFGIRVTRV